MTTVETQGFAPLVSGRVKPSPATDRSASWRLTVVSIALLALLGWGLYDVASEAPLDRGARPGPEQSEPTEAPRFEGWGKWGGYAR